MAKIVKRKKRKKNTAFLNFSIWMFMISATLYLASSIFLRTYNNALSAQTQQMEADIVTLGTQNDAVADSARLYANRAGIPTGRLWYGSCICFYLCSNDADCF